MVRVSTSVLRVKQCLDPQVEEVPTVAVKVLIVQKMTRETNQKSVDAIGKSLKKQTN